MERTVMMKDEALSKVMLPIRNRSGPRSPQRARVRPPGMFLKGPVPWAWLANAGRLPGQALQVGLVLWLESGFKSSNQVTARTASLEEMGVSRTAAYRALNALEAAGLVVVSRSPGKKCVVTLLSAAGKMAK